MNANVNIVEMVQVMPNSGITFLAQIVNDTFFCMIQYVFALNGVLIFLHIDPLHVTTLIKMNNVIENHI